MIAHDPAPAVLDPRRPTACVFGPAYLDRVLLVDAPLRPDHLPPIDGSAEAIQTAFDESGRLTLVQPGGRALAIDTPPDWPGPTGRVRITTPPGHPDTPADHRVRGLGWHDDLGGMGAGFAAALGGTLTSALGPDDDPTTRAVAALLAAHRIAHEPWRVLDRRADWTLLVTSGPHGDKLAVGFRGAHAALRLADVAATPFDPESGLLVVAGLPTALSLAILDRAGPDTLRLLAPSIRTIRDDSPPLASLAGRLDLLSCNRAEWEAASRDTQAALRAATPLIAVTDGPAGVRLLLPQRELAIPAFPRAHPPRDTNRAGEAFASTLLSRLWRSGWRRPMPLDPNLARSAARAATAAAALVLDLERFGFPPPGAIDAALSRGHL
jgi:ribokinase